MMKRLLPSLLLLLAACAPPVRDEVLIVPSRDDATVTVTVETTFTLSPASDQVRDRVEAARSAALANVDPWATRFSRVNALEEQFAVHKQRGATDRVTRTARIAADDLQLMLADTNINVIVMDGEGWRELTFVPGGSTRATRQQLRQFEDDLGSWSRAVSRYLTAMHHIYVYLRENPQREAAVFAVLLNEDGAEASEEELPLLEAASRAMLEIAGAMDDQQEAAARFAESADLIFNPFPGRVTLRAPSEVLSSEGFGMKGQEAVIEPIDVRVLVEELEGEWLSPDPLAALLRDETPTSEQLRQAPRKSTPGVSASDVTAAIRERLARPKVYRLRWRT
jgi:hypothetical protein